MSTNKIEVEMQVLTARQVDDHNGWSTFDVYSDETGLIGNYIADNAEDAIEQAQEDVL